jgi:hypothetical protein
MRYHAAVEQFAMSITQPVSWAQHTIIWLLRNFGKSNASLQALHQTLTIEGGVQLNCQKCQELLPVYIEKKHEDVLSMDERAALTLHLASCMDCLSEYMLLQELEQIAAEPVPHFPAPDLSFLAPAWVPAHGWIYQVWREGNRVARLILQVSEALPSPAPAPALLPVKGTAPPATGREIIHQITLTPDDADDLDIEAVIWQNHSDHQHYAVTVRVQVPSRWPDLAGTEVYAAAADWQARGTTDMDGMVQFEGLPALSLNRLTITVSP